jgi:hypothetical protein
MRQDDAGIGQQPTPIAGMMPAFAQIHDQVEIHRAARAEKDRRPLRREARAVRGDQHIGLEPVFVFPANLAQPGRADFFAGLDQEHRIEAEPASNLQHAIERRHVDRVLALIVGGAAAVEPLADRR